MAIVTTADVKIALGITNAKKDDRIEALIGHCFQAIQDFCNDTFSTFDDGLNLIIIRMIAYMLLNPAGLSSEKIGDYAFVSTTAGWKKILEDLAPWRLVRFT